MGANSSCGTSACCTDHYGRCPNVNDLFNWLDNTCCFYRWGGLGDYILIGLQLYQPEYIIAGAIPVTILAVIIDFSLMKLEKKVTPEGLKGLKEVS